MTCCTDGDSQSHTVSETCASLVDALGALGNRRLPELGLRNGTYKDCSLAVRACTSRTLYTVMLVCRLDATAICVSIIVALLILPK